MMKMAPDPPSAIEKAAVLTHIARAGGTSDHALGMAEQAPSAKTANTQPCGCQPRRHEVRAQTALYAAVAITALHDAGAMTPIAVPRVTPTTCAGSGAGLHAQSGSVAGVAPVQRGKGTEECVMGPLEVTGLHQDQHRYPEREGGTQCWPMCTVVGLDGQE